MFIVFIILFLMVAFYREALLSLIYFLATSPKREVSGSWDLKVRAQRKKIPQVWIHKVQLIETLSLNTYLGSFIFIREELWTSFTNEEKEAYLAWVASSDLRNHTFERLFFHSRTEVLDRDASLLGASPLDLTKALRKTIQFRDQNAPSAMGSWLAGLSFLGPSFFGDWPSHDERLRRIASRLAELEKGG